MKIRGIVKIITFILLCLVVVTIYRNSTIKNTAVEEINSGQENTSDEIHVKISEIIIEDKPIEEYLLINTEGDTLQERFNTPINSQRVEVESDSFAFYLRNLPLKSHGSQVQYFDGSIKSKKGVYEAVVAMELSPVDLQQCADAIMRLRGEYLYEKGDYTGIHFNLTNGFDMAYSKWMSGHRVVVEGNKTSWKKSRSESNTHESFRKYMDFVFIYAGTLSLSQELESKAFNDMVIGDVLIKGGSPGHAVIVVDMAIGEDGQRYFMLAQSYMPAQEIQILANPENDMSPWYKLDDSPSIRTPEWTFENSQLKSFAE